MTQSQNYLVHLNSFEEFVLYFKSNISLSITQSTHGGLEGPLNNSTAIDLGFKAEVQSGAIRKPVRKNLPPVLESMDNAEALAYVSRLLDAA